MRLRPPERGTKVSTVRTYSPKAGDVTQTWHVIDAEDVVLGRLASQVATVDRFTFGDSIAMHSSANTSIPIRVRGSASPAATS